MPLPEKMADAPELATGLELYYYAFGDLMGSRQIGMGYGPIPWKAVQEYCEHHGLDEHQTLAMHHHIQAMDSEFLDYTRRKQPKSGKGN